MKKICLEIGNRHEVYFEEISKDNHYVHLLIQSILKNIQTQIVTMIKSLATEEIFKKQPEVKKML